MINFVFEDIVNKLNFLSCNDVNPSTIRRFGTSPTAQKMIRFQFARELTLQECPDRYIVSCSVNHSPNDWAKPDGCLTYLHPQQLADVRLGRAMVMLDQSFEGYQTSWLWEYLHQDCERAAINPKYLIYVTGNVLADRQYDEWANLNGITNKIKVIPYVLFESDVYKTATNMQLGRTQQQNLEYKQDNLDKIAAYNCLQKRLRAHRIWFYNYLYRENILQYGLVSMNPYNVNNSYFEGRWLDNEQALRANSILPLILYGKNNTEMDDHYYIQRITENVFRDSWVSVVSEASFGDSDGTIFLSEKIFKPIACFHPFIILGNRGSLQKLREMGYKTFDGFIDESYDSLPTFDRFEAIVEELKRIIAIKDKMSWFKSMQDILRHNYETLEKNSKTLHPALQHIQQYYDKNIQR